ncbi:hypothetical protein H257_07036 [Aphanomyces astaci]|uniref:Uncharacterized protein n=1 Tax=Aphanomyces astaci TaxID=112090 RepID=W4GJE3_APHAT|nr:hypothetical protein H257_07036 [Aphanomyces astaci]ETV79817.1 hypothetical protein H257_07036 [Aphanomyces astaci]|eukprot:XP_009830753.1 hypothetical protein H257_07036 [Aphanomyces astaci]
MGRVNPMESAAAAAGESEAKRTQIMRAILQKALDASVHKASLIDMSSPELESNGLQVILGIRQRIEAQFDVLCTKHDLNAKFLELERLLEWHEKSQLGQVVGLTAPLEISAPLTTPQQLLHKERMRLMLQEKARLQQQLQQVHDTNAILEASVHDIHAKSTTMLADIEERLNALSSI